MFGKVTVRLAPGRSFTAYLSGDHVEIIGTIDGHPAHFGSARWNGASLSGATIRLRPDVVEQLNDAIRANASSKPS